MNSQLPSRRRADLLEQSQAALAVERSLWKDVIGKYPGQAGHTPEAWAEWMAAAKAVQQLTKQLKVLRDN
jgi:hypothetical protein